MKRYRKKPVEIEAVKYDGKNGYEISRWAHKDLPGLANSIIIVNGLSLSVVTLEGTMLATIGDWIIKGLNGEFYPCKPDIFEKSYDEV